MGFAKSAAENREQNPPIPRRLSTSASTKPVFRGGSTSRMRHPDCRVRAYACLFDGTRALSSLLENASRTCLISDLCLRASTGFVCSLGSWNTGRSRCKRYADSEHLSDCVEAADGIHRRSIHTDRGFGTRTASDRVSNAADLRGWRIEGGDGRSDCRACSQSHGSRSLVRHSRDTRRCRAEEENATLSVETSIKPHTENAPRCCLSSACLCSYDISPGHYACLLIQASLFLVMDHADVDRDRIHFFEPALDSLFDAFRNRVSFPNALRSVNLDMCLDENEGT
jgi:hypothetical protein